ncbi:MAG: hypothetical protein Q8N23_33715 [Archangium sp.]|nr:hypothetical protein [Archangium sp.]MDP3157677.1 hypothetical protein [Archangium sp.]MDP3575196.1 hypothetical protein [Archangium sp.]
MNEFDGKQPPSPEPELELDRPARPSAPPPRPSVSSPRLQSVQSAARAQPLAPEDRQITSKRLREGAADTLLNSFSILGEVVEDFRNSDRFFKYKAMVISLWFLLAIGSFGVACPSTGPTNDISAVLVVASDGVKPVYMIKNESTETWLDVEILVNGAYRSTMSQMPGEGGNATLSPAVLFDEAGKRAPATLQISDIVVKVREPEAEVPLLRGGAVVQ